MPFITFNNKFLELALLFYFLILEHLLMVPKLMDLTCHTVLYLRYTPLRGTIILTAPYELLPLVPEVLLLGLFLDHAHQMEGGHLFHGLTVRHGRVRIESVLLPHRPFGLEKVLVQLEPFFRVVLDENIYHLLLVFTHVR